LRARVDEPRCHKDGASLDPMSPNVNEELTRTVPCRFCGAAVQHTFLDLGMSPLANSYLKPSQLNEVEPFYPLRLQVCDRCFLVQLEEFASPDQIFSQYAYFSSYSDSWLRHAKSYTDLVVERFALNRQSQVVEIASNDGYLLQYFVALGIPVLGIEPASNVANAAVQKGIPTIVKFFGEEAARQLVAAGSCADLIVGNNVLAHVPKLNDFVRGLKILLKPQGVVTMEFPHLMRLMSENQFDTIYHEHFSYFSLLAVEQVFAAHGLTIFDVEELPSHGGSLRVYVCHQEDRPCGPRVTDLRAREEAAGLTRLDSYFCYAEKVKETKRKLLEFLIAAKRADKSIVGYGAPAKGNTLLNYCGIRSDFIDYTVDRSPHKQGLFLPGSHIPICHPDKVRGTKPDYLLILPWNLKNEIMEQMAHIREWGGQFVVPIPQVQVYS
jgi:2-polyprenyl-3-methyl-5-hydroxy-6-metoxy-1,4-benzoquinol methylase